MHFYEKLPKDIMNELFLNIYKLEGVNGKILKNIVPYSFLEEKIEKYIGDKLTSIIEEKNRKNTLEMV